MTDYSIEDLKRATTDSELTPFSKEQVQRLKQTQSNEEFLTEYKLCIKELKKQVKKNSQ